MSAILLLSVIFSPHRLHRTLKVAIHFQLGTTGLLVWTLSVAGDAMKNYLANWPDKFLPSFVKFF